MSRFSRVFSLTGNKTKSMKAVKVTYTVKREFAEKNNQNIKTFLEEVKAIGDNDMRYHVFLAEDGKTFSHLSIYNNDESQKRFLALKTFLSFQQQRDESGLESEPRVEVLNLLHTSHTIFN
jgi:hypothetical protein